MHILSPETDIIGKENDGRKYFMVKSPRKKVADPDHHSDAYPTEPPRPAFNNLCHTAEASGCGKKLNSHFKRAASLKHDAPDTWHDIPCSHIILTPE